MKLKLRYKGGGGSAQTVSTIPDWARPYVERGLQRADTALTSGELSRVTGQNVIQKEAQAAALDAAQNQGAVTGATTGALGQLARTAAGEEIVPASTGATEAIKQAAIHQAAKDAQPGIATAASRGTVGGARQLVKAGSAQADLTSKLAGLDYADLQARRQAAQAAAGQTIQGGSQVQEQLMAPAATMKGVGSDIQKQSQAEADAAFQGLSRYSSLVQGTPWQSQQQKAGGK